MPATTLTSECYSGMFNECTMIKVSDTPTEAYTIEWRIPATGDVVSEGENWNSNMLASTGGTFTGNPSANTTYYIMDPNYVEPVPENLTVENVITFSSMADFSLTATARGWNNNLYYSTNLATWDKWDGSEISSADGKLYLCGSGNTTVSEENSWQLNGENIECSGNIMNLLDYKTVAEGGQPTMSNSCFSLLFFECTNLITPPELPATTLSENCYLGMFKGCTALTTLPELPATTLANVCYANMFSGCTGIKVSDTKVNAYSIEWRIPNAGEISSSDVWGWNWNMLSGTGGTFTGNPDANATYYLWNPEYVKPVPGELTADNAVAFESNADFTLAANQKGWNGYLFHSTDLKTWTEWDGSAISSAAGKLYLCGKENTKVGGGYDYRWSIICDAGVECSGNIENLLDYNVVAASEHPEMADYCFDHLFEACPLTTAPALPATTLTKNCYAGLFVFTLLTEAPELPATTLAENCYNEMFWGCSELTTPPALPATTLANNCYESMFNGCKSLATAPALPATTLASFCYNNMFGNCTGLTEAPALPATTLASYCYWDMFNGCKSLTTPPALPATTLAIYCYYGMFNGCKSLNTLPELPATTLANVCYANMFSGCTGIKVSDTKVNAYSIEWRIPNAGEISSSDVWGWNWNMLSGTGGTFTGNPDANATYYLWNPEYVKPVPGELTADNAVAFESNADFTLAANQKGWNGYLFHSTDLKTWTEWDGSAISSTNGRLYVCGEGNTKVGGDVDYKWILTGDESIDCSGDIMNLLDYKTVANGKHPAMNSGCYMNLFNGCTKLTKAPELPATTLANSCYANMFRGCTSLTTLPELPATTLAYYCYSDMFNGCTSLTTLPELPATTLANYCYSGMFNGCTGIKVSETRTDSYTLPWKAASLGSTEDLPVGWNNMMFEGTGGTFTGSPEANRDYYLYTGNETGITTSKATSISLRLYPNPAHNHVCITGLPEAATTIRIYDVAGRLVLTSTTDGSESQTIDVSGLAKGLH